MKIEKLAPNGAIPVKDFVPNTGNKDYFSINTGLNYRLDAKTNLGLSFATTANKAYSHDNTLGASIRVSF